MISLKKILSEATLNEAGMNPVKKVVNAILKKHKIEAMKTYASSVRGAHNIINGGYRWEGDWHLGFYGNVPQDVIEKVAAEMEKAGVKYVKVTKGHISADFTKTGLSEDKPSVNEDTRRAKLLGIDFNISEMNGRIFFSFVDKKAASLKIREIGTNKIVNLIQKSLDNAYGKGELFFKGGDHAEFQNGYLFQRNLTNVKLNKLKFESVNEDKGPCWKGYKQVGMKDKGGRQVPNCVPNESVVKEISSKTPKIFVKTAAVEKKIRELMDDRKKAVVPYNSEKDPKKKEILKQILIKLTKQIQGYEKNLVQLRDMEEEYLQQMHADAELDTTGL